MNTPNPVAMIAAALLTVAGLVVLTSNLNHPPRTHATSVPVTNLAPVIVTASALGAPATARARITPRATAFAGPTFTAAAATAPWHGAAGGSLSLLPSQFIMPYYSFGTTFGRSNKE